uniref:Uncharacterized protein n=1 Tax=Oryza sativa subsp. japonica TaxID=39947 RepID=Q6ZCY4_ORYSJ|nr:hypothetical protein [Oryza sativa Japonica Group]
MSFNDVAASGSAGSGDGAATLRWCLAGCFQVAPVDNIMMSFNNIAASVTMLALVMGQQLFGGVQLDAPQ